MKTRKWIIILSALVLLCAVCWLVITNFSYQTQVVGIYQDGQLVEKIDLGSVTQEREITLSGESGENVILISHGHIKMKSADCPDKICVNHGELKTASSPIVCLPNKVIIKFENKLDDT